MGKTTIARILAKCLNCEQGVSARPCGECDSCKEIAEGRFVDLIEVDAASRTKVEDTRELLDNVQYAPTRGRYKVYLIDEVHMLSTHSFNALLKTLEEPPEHVKFLLATTDPQKLPVTVLSRCLQFGLKNMTPERIVTYLSKILGEESVTYDEGALWQLGRAAQGSMRDALSLTDQAIAYGQGNVGEEQVNAMLGTIDRGRVFRLAGLIARGQVPALLDEVALMAEHAPDYDEVVQALMQLWHKVAVAQVAPESTDNSMGEKDAILSLASAMRPEDLQLYYQTALVGRKDLPLAADPRQGFEMILLRMLAFRPVMTAPVDLDVTCTLDAAEINTVSSVQADPVAAEDSGVEAGKKQFPDPEPSLPDTSSPEIPVSVEPAEMVAAEFPSEPVSGAPSGNEETNNFVDDVSEQLSEAVPEPAETVPEPVSYSGGAAALMNQPARTQDSVPEPLLSSSSSVDQQENSASETRNRNEEFSFVLDELNPVNWWEWVRNLPLAGMPMAVALNSALIQREGAHLIMDVDPDQGALYNDAQRQRIEQVLSDKTGENVTLVMNLQPPRGETPHQRKNRLMADRLVEAEQSVADDENIQALISDFGAHIIDGSIRPLTAEC